MLTLETLKDTVDFAKKARETEGAMIVTAQKPSGKFVVAERIPAGASGVTYNRKGVFEQNWETKVESWLVTACDADGNAFQAEDPEHPGVFHVNAWPMEDADFEERYGVENIGPNGVVEAKSIPQLFVRLDEAIGVPEDGVRIHQSWGTDEVMAQGAMLNIDRIDKNDVYAVDPVFFAENYEVLDVPEPEKSSEPSFPSFDELRARVRDGLDHVADVVRSGIDGFSEPEADDSDKGLGE